MEDVFYYRGHKLNKLVKVSKKKVIKEFLRFVNDRVTKCERCGRLYAAKFKGSKTEMNFNNIVDEIQKKPNNFVILWSEDISPEEPENPLYYILDYFTFSVHNYLVSHEKCGK